MGLNGYALQTEINTEIVSAYAASQQDIPAVLAAPGWYTFAEFYLGKTVKCRLELIASVSHVSLAGTARLYDPTLGIDAPVSGTDTPFASLTSDRFLSGIVTLTGLRRYLIQAQCVGAVGLDKFATVQTASLGGV